MTLLFILTALLPQGFSCITITGTYLNPVVSDKCFNNGLLLVFTVSYLAKYANSHCLKD